MSPNVILTALDKPNIAGYDRPREERRIQRPAPGLKAQPDATPELRPTIMAIQTNAKPNKEPVMIAVPFYPDELETIAQDVEALLHKKILRVPSHTDPNMKAQIFIRFAVLDYTHKAIQKQLDNDTDKVHQAKRVVNEMEAMMKSMRTREKALVDKETELVHSQEVAQEIVAKYMKLLKDRGFLNEGTS